MFGSGGADLGFGTFRTTGEIQTRLSQKISPSRKWSYRKILFRGLVGLLVLEFILGYMDTFLRVGSSFDQQLIWFGYTWLGLVAFTLCLAVRHNFGVYPRRNRLWNQSFMCRSCGCVFQQAEMSDPTALPVRWTAVCDRIQKRGQVARQV